MSLATYPIYQCQRIVVRMRMDSKSNLAGTRTRHAAPVQRRWNRDHWNAQREPHSRRDREATGERCLI